MAESLKVDIVQRLESLWILGYFPRSYYQAENHRTMSFFFISHDDVLVVYFMYLKSERRDFNHYSLHFLFKKVKSLKTSFFCIIQSE